MTDLVTVFMRLLARLWPMTEGQSDYVTEATRQHLSRMDSLGGGR